MFSTKNYLSLIISQCLFYYPLRAAVSISLLHGCFWLDWHSWQHCAFTFCKKMLSNYQVPAGLASRNSVADVPFKFTWIVLWLIYHIPVLFNAFLVNSACGCSISVFILITEQDPRVDNSFSSSPSFGIFMRSLMVYCCFSISSSNW